MSYHKQRGRLQIINDCLSNGKYWSTEKLLDRMLKQDIEITDRTLKRDIELMKHCSQLCYYAPIEYCKKNKGYHYSHSDYSIDRIPLNKKDIDALNIAATTLAQYKFLPLMTEFKDTVDKIIRVVNRAKQSNHESLLDFIYFEKTPVSAGLENLDEIISAIQQKLSIQITYKKFNTDHAKKRVIHPYFLKEYRNRWFLVGLNDVDQIIKTFGLERIIAIDNSYTTYIENKTLNKKDFFADVIGIGQVEEKSSQVILQFNNKQADYIKTQKLHSSQAILSEEKEIGITISLHVIINYELIGILLGYGADVKVIEPKSLAEKIKEIAIRITNTY